MNILNYTYDELASRFEQAGQKKFQGKQVFEWIHQKRVFDTDLMTNISINDRAVIKQKFNMPSLKISEIQESKDGATKFLFELEDGNLIETVLMKQEYGNSVCVTTQVGCNMGCKFCASGLLKKVRDLEAGEIVEQVLQVQKYLDRFNQRVSHIVIMGIGEPFDNWANTKQFINVINDPKGLAIGVRHITVSTSGLVPGIRDLADWEKRINLAISLHAPTDEKRTKLMPVNSKWNLAELVDALKYYDEKTGRRITLEYIMLSGVNDTFHDAAELSRIAKSVHAHVNLIPFNSVDESGFKKTPAEIVNKFFEELKKRNVNVTKRREFGSDIDAACGQLRAKKEVK